MGYDEVFFLHLRFLTSLVMSLILAPGLHKAFLLLCLPFLSEPLQVSCRALTIESPTRNACSTLGEQALEEIISSLDPSIKPILWVTLT